MIVVNLQGNEITEYDLTKGTLQKSIRIRPDAEPLSDTKLVWNDDDYEKVMVYEPNPEEPVGPNLSIEQLRADLDYVMLMGGD